MFRVVFFLHFIFFAKAQWEYESINDDLCKTPHHQDGKCILIYSCKPIMDLLDQVPQPLPLEISNYLKSYHCGFDGNTPKVCCPSKPIYFNNEDESIFSDVSKHRNTNLLPRNCGQFNSLDKIVNGNKTDLLEFPWMALLSYQTRYGPQFKCGGTIINSRYILTAAHCVTNLNMPLLGVRVGEHDIRTVTDCEINKHNERFCAPPFQDLQIEKIIPHPQFNKKFLTNDIALLRVAPIKPLENSLPVCLPLAESRNYNFTNRNVIVTGWGMTENGRASPDLKKVSLSVVPLEECKRLYKTTADLDKRQLCAGGKNKDSCGGDSGGPLQVLGRILGETRIVQQGVVSFGPKKCGSILPGVYTRVAAFMDWILDNVEP
ncbi:melanization protease 1-like isoform X2 [Tribolium madens]|uniref:melanization protease 1-like isoform X2 n=1 Tax=Tribolium madens TaxID=41895 RepID=UPI001CF72560|nr:melanization protease 1-like isoform X2 [Tribolium madens]